MSSTPFDVIVCGSLHLDIVVTAPSLPLPDETVVGHGWSQVCGGKGGNQAVQAARAGARVAMIGRVGDDEFGRTLLANLEHAGVDHSAVATDKVAGSGMSVAILKDDGDYGAVIVSGSNLAIAVDGLTALWNQLHGARVLVLQNEVPHAVNVAIARIARAAGATVILNAAPARDVGHDLLNLVDVLVLNRVEAAAMFGLPVFDPQSATAALKKNLGGDRSIIITLGPHGLVFNTDDFTIMQLAAKSVKVTSTHGAGDCFVGVLAAELARDVDLLDACKAANRRAAEFVSR
jgi:ribokinase